MINLQRMLIRNEVSKAVKKCMRQSIPFAVAFMPDSNECLFFAARETVELNGGIPEGWNGFITAKFALGDSQNPIGIPAQLSVEDILASDSDQNINQSDSDSKGQESTRYADYCDIISNVVESFESIGTKVVISRLISNESAVHPLNVAEKYFSSFTACFRCLYYTPQTGLWIVATPEILLSYSATENRLRTMSLAGTRKVGENAWDVKNEMEHKLVTDYIAERLKSEGLEVNIGEPCELRFGVIEHLCNHIEASGEIDVMKLAMKLSPTPAVCGWPVDSAYAKIRNYERHDRGCYGSFIGIASDCEVNLFVNLRCARIIPQDNNSFQYEMYSGGGINKMSVAETEWTETEMKIGPLYKLVTNKSINLS